MYLYSIIYNVPILNYLITIPTITVLQLYILKSKLTFKSFSSDAFKIIVDYFFFIPSLYYVIAPSFIYSIGTIIHKILYIIILYSFFFFILYLFYF